MDNIGNTVPVFNQEFSKQAKVNTVSVFNQELSNKQMK